MDKESLSPEFSFTVQNAVPKIIYFQAFNLWERSSISTIPLQQAKNHKMILE